MPVIAQRKPGVWSVRVMWRNTCELENKQSTVFWTLNDSWSRSVNFAKHRSRTRATASRCCSPPDSNKASKKINGLPMSIVLHSWKVIKNHHTVCKSLDFWSKSLDWFAISYFLRYKPLHANVVSQHQRQKRSWRLQDNSLLKRTTWRAWMPKSFKLDKLNLKFGQNVMKCRCDSFLASQPNLLHLSNFGLSTAWPKQLRGIASSKRSVYVTCAFKAAQLHSLAQVCWRLCEARMWFCGILLYTELLNKTGIIYQKT